MRRAPGRWLHRLALLLACASGGSHAGSDWPARDPAADLRVMSWNVSRASYFARPEATAAQLRAIGADLLLLDEMPAEATAERIRASVAAALPARDWQVELGDVGGNHERAAIVAPWPLQRLDRFDRLHYPRRELRRWQAAAESSRTRWGELLGRMSAVAAIADVGERRVLLVAFDMQCCGDSPQSWEEQRRRREARLLREALDASLREAAIDAVIVSGDANTVQGMVPVEILGGAGGEHALRRAEPRRANGSDWTWDGRGTPYPSHRMDYQWHDAALAVVAAHIFDTEVLSPAVLQAWQLDADTSRTASAHRPLVVDLRWAQPAP